MALLRPSYPQPEPYERWRERIEREGVPDPPVIFAGNWARKAIEDLEAEVGRLRDLVSTLHLYIGHHTETQLTTAQKELLYDVVEAHYRAEGISDEPMERWWR